MDFPWIILAVVIVILGGVMVFSIFLERKRTENIKALAGSLAMKYQAADSGNIVLKSCYASKLLNTGRRRKIYNILAKSEDGLDIIMFDYKYVTGTGKHQTTHKKFITLIRSKDIELPIFHMRPEGFGDKLSNLFGYKDIDFPNNVRFSDSYLLQGEDEDLVRKSFQFDILQFFENNKGWSVESTINEMILFRNKRPASFELLDHLKSCIRITRLFIRTSHFV